MNKILIFVLLITGLTYPESDAGLYQQAVVQYQHEQDSIKHYADSIATIPAIVIQETIIPKTVNIGGPEFDSLQSQIDSITLKLKNNKHWRKLLDYDIQNKISYIKFLVKNKLELQANIRNTLNDIVIIKQLEIDQVYAYLPKHTGMEKALLFANIKKLKNEKIKLMALSY